MRLILTDNPVQNSCLKFWGRVKHNSYYLIETLAEKIAQKILEDKRILSAEITIKKKAVWDNGVPGLTIVRENK